MKKELFKINIDYTKEKLKEGSLLVNKKYFIIMAIAFLFFSITWVVLIINWDFFYWVICCLLSCLYYIIVMKVYRQDGIMNQFKFKYHKDNASIVLTFKEDEIEVYENETKWSYALYYNQILALKESKSMFWLIMWMPKCFHIIEKSQLKEEDISKFKEFINSKIEENKKNRRNRKNKK